MQHRASLVFKSLLVNLICRWGCKPLIYIILNNFMLFQNKFYWNKRLLWYLLNIADEKIKHDTSFFFLNCFLQFLYTMSTHYMGSFPNGCMNFQISFPSCNSLSLCLYDVKITRSIKLILLHSTNQSIDELVSCFWWLWCHIGIFFRTIIWSFPLQQSLFSL